MKRCRSMEEALLMLDAFDEVGVEIERLTEGKRRLNIDLDLGGGDIAATFDEDDDFSTLSRSPAAKDTSFNALADFIHSDSFWKDVLSMGIDARKDDDLKADFFSLSSMSLEDPKKMATTFSSPVSIAESTTATLRKSANYASMIEKTKSMEIAVVITESDRPFHVKYVNRAWSDLCGYGSSEAIGRSLKLIQGPKTNSVILEKLGEAVSNGQEFETELVNYMKSGKAFSNHLKVFPYRDRAGIRCMVGILQSTSQVLAC